MNEKKDEVIQEVDKKEVSDNSGQNSEINEKKVEEHKNESSEADTPQAYPEKFSTTPKGVPREKKNFSTKGKISTEGKKNEFVEKVRENPWIISSIILGILLLGFLFSSSGVTGGVITGGAVASGEIISAKVAGEKMVDFANANGADAKLVEVNDRGNFYEVVLLIEGNELSLYVTKDGESFTQSLIPLVEDENKKLASIDENNLEDSLVN